ncbi:hypothetical protein E2562_036571 [Oryza meyeriana var. granulata]|uniref:Uncharacterized protein n=1 Tax=Oryza meyeriana var. granulata TaxID=110450 RepID=A0A6G1EBG6_9ORYZ|nr:hypothetical protein E2562_036571 [Oryza meyeriana var. granulata]
MAIAQQVTHDLAKIHILLAVVQLSARAALATLSKAAALLREDINDTKILVDDAFAFVPTSDDRDHEATLAAAAKLVVRVFSEAPVFPGAISAAMDLVASVCALPPPVIGALQNAQGVLTMAGID